MRVRMGFRAPEDVANRIAGYMAERGLNQSEAILRLVSIGLAVENDACYASELARVVKATMRAELESFGLRLQDALDAQSEAACSNADRAAAAAYAALLAAVDAAGPEDPEEACMVYDVAGAAMLFGEGRGAAMDRGRRATVGDASDLQSALWD